MFNPIPMVKQHSPPPPKSSPWPPGITILLLALAMAALKWEDVARLLKDGNWGLAQERQEELEDTLERNENAEQYVLIATVSGWYECYLCEEGKYWLNEGEIAKIGITTNPAERYSQQWLKDHRVNYHVETEGDLAAVRKAEIERIASYPFTPENMKRPKDKRLVVPVFHKTYSLR